MQHNFAFHQLGFLFEHSIQNENDHRAIIARAMPHITAERKSARDRSHHGILTERRDFHGVTPLTVCHHMRASIVALKHWCMKIGTRIEPDHS